MEHGINRHAEADHAGGGSDHARIRRDHSADGFGHRTDGRVGHGHDLPDLATLLDEGGHDRGAARQLLENVNRLDAELTDRVRGVVRGGGEFLGGGAGSRQGRVYGGAGLGESLFYGVPVINDLLRGLLKCRIQARNVLLRLGKGHFATAIGIHYGADAGAVGNLGTF